MKEAEIRPKEIFDQYLALCAADIKTYFQDTEYRNINCPACRETGEFSFNKQGFGYCHCPACRTLFVSPRPSRESFDLYYRDSPSTKFWATEFYRVTEAARREKLWKPKAELIRNKIVEFGKDTETLIDIGGGYGIFLEEFARISPVAVTAIEPSRHLAGIIREKGINLIENFLEDITPGQLPAEKKAFVSFELFEHLHCPESFLARLHDLMRQGELFIFTTLSGTGIDIRVLWEKSKSVSPPHHLNFFNPWSIRTLLERCGFSLLEVSTPGKLDIDILRNSREMIEDRFFKTVLEIPDDNMTAALQNFVSTNLLSSHMMVVCTKQ
ncbi:MAG: class I SAM-dependent methyltransferase [Candidatus Wallbacteria bacterium]|nr:class I SAM-dependent methyltransferase [Candidatus Wallbacteria bacterium]